MQDVFVNQFEAMRARGKRLERAALMDAVHTARERLAKAEADLAKLDQPDAPSKAHLKRNARAKAETFTETIPPARQRTAEAEARMAFTKQLFADLGGTRTIVATPGSEKVDYITYHGNR